MKTLIRWLWKAIVAFLVELAGSGLEFRGWIVTIDFIDRSGRRVLRRIVLTRTESAILDNAGVVDTQTWITPVLVVLSLIYFNHGW